MTRDAKAVSFDFDDDSSWLVAPDINRVYSPLYGWQQPAAEGIIDIQSKCRESLDLSDTGAGKTFTALVACRELGLRPFVVTTTAGLYDWHDVAKTVGVKPVAVVNYEKIRRGNTPWLVIGENGYQWRLPANSIILWDEAQKLKGNGTQNSKMSIAATRAKIRQHFISASIASDPTHFLALGYALGLHKLDDWIHFLRSHGCFWLENKTGGSWQFAGSRQHILKLHHAIRARSVRIRVSDVPGFPECAFFAKAVQTNNVTEIRDAYAALQDAIAKADGQNQMVLKLRARQKSELGKIGPIAEMVRNLIDEGCSVPVFLNFSDSISILSKLLPGCVLYHGGMSMSEKEKSKRLFQSDTARVMLIQIQAGGASMNLQDVNGRYPRYSIISPSWSAQDILQCKGRISRATAKSKARVCILFAADTVEETVLHSCKKKLSNINKLNDGDLLPFKLEMRA